MESKQPHRRGRRGLRAAYAALAGVLTLGACAGQGIGGGTHGAAHSGGKVTLKFWNGLTGGDKATIDKLVGAFNASHQDIKVESDPMPWDVFYQKLLTGVSSGNGPDIVGMDAMQIPKYAQSGVLQPVDEYYSEPETGADELVPSSVQASMFHGRNYGVPLETAPLMLYWNKTLFKRAGLDPDRPPATLAQFEQDAARLTKDADHDGKPEQYAIALADHETIPMYPVLLWGSGGRVVSQDGRRATLDDPATLSAVQHWSDLVRKKKVSPVGVNGADADKLFQTQKAAMEIVGPWDTSTFTQAGVDYGVTMPFGGSRTRATATNITSLALTSDDPVTKRAAYTFFSFWNSKQSQLTFAKGTGFPSDRTDLTAKDLKGHPYPAAFGAPQVLRSSRPFLPGLVPAPTIQDQVFYPALQRILNGRGSVAATLKKADADVQKQLDQTG